MKALILFGSKSDQYFYNELVKEVDGLCDFELFILSAHRDPDKLEETLKNEKYDFIIAGAGLAAHLPGVIASKVKCPVFGLPVDCQFSGLDAFLSIVQMPPGIPVLCEAANNFTSTILFIKNLLNNKYPKLLNIVISEDLEELEMTKSVLDKAKEKAKELNVELKQSQLTCEDLINLVFTRGGATGVISHNSIYIPIMNKELYSRPESALDFFNATKKGGLWLGVNNSKNAVIMFEKLMKGVIRC